MTATTESESESYCTFRVDDMLFGIEVKRVQEVIRYQPTTRIPLASKLVHGLMNLRGQIVSAMNLRERLGIPQVDDDRRPMNVVIRTVDGPLSLLVDEIGDVVQVEKSRFEPPPETLHGQQRELMKGAYKLDGQLLLILDTDRATQVAA